MDPPPPTYLTSHIPPTMQCVMEIFTYMIMGGSTDQITVLLLPLSREGQQDLVHNFKHFSESTASYQ